MSENQKSILNAKVVPAKFRSPNSTLSILRFVAVTALILGILVCIFSFLGYVGDVRNTYIGEKVSPLPLVLYLVSLAQGFIIFALFNALALIVENLVAIREGFSQPNKNF
jgi:hypothetical protein